MSEETSDLLGKILWFLMFITPLITIPLVWWAFKVQKTFRVIIGLALAGFISFFLYHISLSLIFRNGFSATVTSGFPDIDILNRDTTFVNGNVTTTISSDIEHLGKLIDFNTYKPVKV